MKIKAVVGAAVAAALTFVVVGCSSRSPGAPETTSAAATSEDSGGAPAIPEPGIDASKHLQTPCDLLTAAQIGPLNVRGGSVQSDDAGTFCAWRPVDVHNPSYSVGVTDKTTLKGLYQKKDTWPVFNPGQVRGYPAVSGSPDAPTVEGACVMYVGLSANTTLYVSVQLPDRKNSNFANPCPLNQKVAETVMGNLKGGQ